MVDKAQKWIENHPNAKHEKRVEYRQYIQDIKANIKNLKSSRSALQTQLNSLPAYATGSKHIQEDEMAWTQDGGQEIIYRSLDGAMLTPLGQGDIRLMMLYCGKTTQTS